MKIKLKRLPFKNVMKIKWIHIYENIWHIVDTQYMLISLFPKGD